MRGHEHDALVNRISALIKGTLGSSLALFLPCKTTRSQPPPSRTRAVARTDHTDTLIFDVPASSTVRGEYLLHISLPICGTL